MKNKRTYYQLILDRSGSMFECMEQTVTGVNEQIMRIKEIASRFPEQELFTSLTLFNHQITKTWIRVSPEELKEITFSDYRPDGTTALHDAIGFTLDELQKSVGQEVEDNEASVVVIIITDGYENSSKTFSHNQVASLIKELEQTGKWTFSYMGATLDAVDIAVSLNIKKGNSMYFKIDKQDKVYHTMNNSLHHYIRNKQDGKIDEDFLKDDE